MSPPFFSQVNLLEYLKRKPSLLELDTIPAFTVFMGEHKGTSIQIMYFYTLEHIPGMKSENKVVWHGIQKTKSFSPSSNWDISVFNFSWETESRKKNKNHTAFFLLFDRTMNIQLLTVNYSIKLIKRSELTKGNIMPINVHSKILWLTQCEIQAYKKNMLTLYHLVITQCFVYVFNLLLWLKFPVERLLKRKKKETKEDKKQKESIATIKERIATRCEESLFIFIVNSN